MISRDGIFLIHPPFTDSRGPYVAIPQLAAYLHSRKIPVKAADLGAAFLKHLLTPDSHRQGRGPCRKAFPGTESKAQPICNPQH